MIIKIPSRIADLLAVMGGIVFMILAFALQVWWLAILGILGGGLALFRLEKGKREEDYWREYWQKEGKK